jgi:hypothetical protein
MQHMIAPILAGLAVLYALAVLLSVHPTPSGPALIKSNERVADMGSLLIQAVMLQQRQQQSNDRPEISNADRTMRAQQALKENGFYSGAVDGVMRKGTQEAIQSFQESKDLEVTGTINEETARELRIQ